MTQEELGKEEKEVKAEEKPDPKPKKVKWEKDEEDLDAEVVKLGVGESIEGIFIDQFHSGKHNAECYKIKGKDDEKAKIILATTILEKKMSSKTIGDTVKIERVEDGTNQAGVTYQKYETYHDKED